MSVFERRLPASLALTAVVVVLVYLVKVLLRGGGLTAISVLVLIAAIVCACAWTAWVYRRRTSRDRRSA